MRSLTPDDIKRENAYRAAQRKAGKSRKSNIKDPNAPKKPLSAYFMFLQRIRANPKLVHDIFGNETETTKQSVLAAAKWRSMTDAERQVPTSPFIHSPSHPHDSPSWPRLNTRKWSTKPQGDSTRTVPLPMAPTSISVSYPTALLSPPSRWNPLKATVKVSVQMRVIASLDLEYAFGSSRTNFLTTLMISTLTDILQPMIPFLSAEFNFLLGSSSWTTSSYLYLYISLTSSVEPFSVAQILSP